MTHSCLWGRASTPALAVTSRLTLTVLPPYLPFCKGLGSCGRGAWRADKQGTSPHPPTVDISERQEPARR